MKIFILRGIPGSGKTSWVDDLKSISDEHILVCSADDYHTINGIYKYDQSKAALAHQYCLRKYIETITRSISDKIIIVDNTNTTLLEIAPYVRVAEAFEIEYTIVEFICPIELSIKRNTHNVPASTIKMMINNLYTERLPSYWRVEIVLSKEN